MSTARIETISQGFQCRPGVGSAAGDGTSIAFRRAQSDACACKLGSAFDEARSSAADASLDARAGSLPEEDSTILSIALLDAS